MNKRGISQVDWAISLAVFLLYIAWFFVFVTPVSERAELTNLIPLVEDRLLEDISWSVYKAPMIITSNTTLINEPLIVEFPFDIENFYLDGKYWILDRGNLIFLDNLSEEENTFWIVDSDESYSLPFVMNDLEPNSEFSSTTGFKAYFYNSMFYKADYPTQKINGVSYNLNSVSLDVTTNSFTSTPITSIYKVINQAINHTSYIFAKNQKVYNYIDLNVEGNYIFELSFDLFKYSNYFTDNLYMGVFNYSQNETFEYSGDILSLYSSNSVLTLILGEESEIILHHTNSSNLQLTVEIPFSSNTFYNLIFHEDLDDREDFIVPYSAKFGMFEGEEGISLEKLLILNQSDYKTLKSDYNYPKDKDFSIELSNSTTTLFNKGPVPPVTNIYSKETTQWMLDKLSGKTKLNLIIKTW
ncbi:hypothetical protein H8D83_01335 [Candidatus Woesearchaeota archaeon]|nr:hypothetical protein [Candidatus Woesearchaeota archaeon]MBL7050863.1 hypothetical protein [Candidatus Woesearchaeota archaeon]